MGEVSAYRQRIGIMGGTFDPIHIGHLIIAQEAYYQLGLDRIIFIPAGSPPHKPDEPISDQEHRYRMVVLATESNPAFETSRMELERLGPSYTVDTLQELKKVYGKDTDLYFIMGADSLLEMMSWRQPEKILQLSTIIAANRPGFNLNAAKNLLPNEFFDKIILINGPGVNISATELRHRVAAGMPIMYLVPRAVEYYIKENNLYEANE